MPDYRRAILFGGLFIGPYTIYASTADLVKTHTLESHGTLVQARVVDARVTDSPLSGTSRGVKYAFDAGGATYTNVESVGSPGVWAQVTRAAYERAAAEHTIAVRYDPSDPWTNQPVATPTVPTLNRVVGVLAGFLCMVPAVLVLVGLALGGKKGTQEREAG